MSYKGRPRLPSLDGPFSTIPSSFGCALGGRRLLKEIFLVSSGDIFTTTASPLTTSTT